MTVNLKRGVGFWVLILLSTLLTLLLLCGQTLSLFDYDLAVSLGLQESIDEIGAVGTTFAKGFAFGDTIFYVPLLIIGIIGMLKNRHWGAATLFASMAVSIYWPLVHLHAIYAGRAILNLPPAKYLSYSIVLPLIVLFGIWGMWYLYENHLKGVPNDRPWIKPD